MDWGQIYYLFYVSNVGVYPILPEDTSQLVLDIQYKFADSNYESSTSSLKQGCPEMGAPKDGRRVGSRNYF